MKKIIFLLAFLFATITYAQTPARHYGGVILGSFASDPTGVMEGQIYWNTTDNKFRAYDGSIWFDLVSSGLIFPNREIVFGNGTGVESNSNIQANGIAGYIRLTDGTNTSNLYSNRTEIRDNTNVYGSLFKDHIRFYDGTSFNQEIYAGVVTANRVLTIPDASGTIALTSDIPNISNFVDFTTAQTITGEKTFNNIIVNDQAGSTDYKLNVLSGQFDITNTVNGNFFRVQNNTLKFRESGGFINTFDYGSITANQTYTMPDATGTLALTDVDNQFSVSQQFDDNIVVRDYSTFIPEISFPTPMNLGKIIYGGTSADFKLYTSSGNKYYGFGTDVIVYNNQLNVKSNLDFSSINTSDKTFTFPNTSGTIALTSDVSNVSDFMKQVNAGTGEIYWFGAYPGNTVNANNNGTYILIDDSTVQDIALVADGGVRISSTTASATLKTNLLTLSRDFEFPNASGTLALTSDIPTSTDYVDLTSAQTISGDKTFSGTNDVTGALRIFVDDNFDVSGNGAISQIMKKDTDASGTQVMTYDRITYDGTPSGSTQGKYNYYRYQGQSQSTNAWHNVNYYRVEDDEDNNTSVLPNSSLQNYNLMYQRSSGTGQNISGEFGNNINRQYWDSGYGGGYMDEAYNVFNILSYDNSDWTTGEWWSSTNKVEATAGTITNLKGVSQTINLSGTVNNSNLYGFYFDYTNTSSGTQPTNAFAFYNNSSLPIFSDGDIEIGNASDILLDDNGSGSGASRVEWNANNYIEYDDQTESTLYIKGGNGIILAGDVGTNNNNVFVGSGKVHTGSSGGSATIENDDLKLVRGIGGNPEVTATAGAVTHAISFDANGGSNTTLSTPNGYVGQIAVAHEKTPQIEIGSSGGSTSSTDGKDFYYLKWTGGNGNETFNLPSATTNQYRTLQFITNSTVTANTTWTLDGSGSQTIDGSLTYVINRAYEGIKLWSDGTEWIIIQAKK